jgi:branched-chain amino acid aminotransferase
MPVKPTEHIWMNGNMVRWEDAKIHVLSHVIHYGSSVFEGMRVYKTPKGPAAFRLRDHSERLINSAKIYRMEVPYTLDQIDAAIIKTIVVNKMEECYVRPVIYRGYGEVGVNPFNSPTELAIATWDWGKYLGAEALENGVSVCISSWTRPAPNTIPMMAKAGANYMNGQLIKMEAITNGYVEGIALDTQGHVSEGSGENIFIVQKGVLYTPPLSASILPGITRDSIMTLARDMGIEVVELNIPRELLYIADEVFFTGSAAEVTPISKVDQITVGTGKCGEITRRLQKRFFAVINGEVPDTHHWLTPIPVMNTVKV